MVGKRSHQKGREPHKETPKQPATPSASSKALVFISHDNRDADIAEAFGNLLSDVSAGMLKSFRSSDKTGTSGIEYGTEWYGTIMSKLDDATDVVALLTQHSVERPWILYEAGVAKGKLNTNVLGIALGIPLERVTTAGPFGQFQNANGDESSLTGLVMQLVRRNPDAEPREEAIRAQVKVFLTKLADLLSKRSSSKKTVAPPGEEQTAAKLFEEVKAMVRDLPDRVEDRVRAVSRRGPFRGKRRFHPEMLEEFMFSRAIDGGDTTLASFLVFLSLFRDDVPWIFEAGMEFYRAVRSGNVSAAKDARTQLGLVVESTIHGPFVHEVMRPDDDVAFMMMRHMPQLLDQYVSRIGLPGSRDRKGGHSRSTESTAQGGTK